MATIVIMKITFSANLRKYDKVLKQEFNILGKRILENMLKIDKNPHIETSFQYK